MTQERLMGMRDRTRASEAPAPLIASSEDGVMRSIHENHYLVAGSSIADLRDAIALLGPKRDGRPLGSFSSWSIRWTFEARSCPGGFATAGLTVALGAIVTLPRWEPPATADAATRTAWNRYVTALSAHEAGHIALANAAVDEIALRLDRLEAFSPSALHQAGDKIARACVARARAGEAHFDHRTRHGATRGARLGLRLVTASEPAGREDRR